MWCGIFSEYRHIRDDIETLKEFLFKSLTENSQPDKKLFEMLFWAIQKNRNKVWENVNPLIVGAIARARDDLADWEAA